MAENPRLEAAMRAVFGDRYRQREHRIDSDTPIKMTKSQLDSIIALYAEQRGDDLQASMEEEKREESEHWANRQDVKDEAAKRLADGINKGV
jgi:hypothetical protein